MKKRTMTALAVAVSAFALILCVSCESLGFADGGMGELRLTFESIVASDARAVTEIPDTSDFLLRITDSSGKSVYDGIYGGCPESLKVPAGSYEVNVRSIEFSKPEFSSPQYGDSQCVVVEKDGVVNVGLVCRQLNSGIRLSIDPGFLTAYPDGILFLKSAQGKLMYSYSEKRIAYFCPGPVSLVLSKGARDEILMTRELEPQQILVLGVGVSGAGAPSGRKGISIEVDTTRNWTQERFIIGGQISGTGASPEKAMTVAQARSLAPMTDVWVSGYIVGGDLTSASGNFEEPFKMRSNLILGPRSSTQDRSVCLAVQLQAGGLRDDLNLVDNPSLLGRKVCLRGDLVGDYFNLVGLKNLKDVVY